MKIKYRNYELEASIHTVNIRSENKPTVRSDAKFINVTGIPNRVTGEYAYFSKINPHNYAGKELLKYSEYEEAISAIIQETGLQNYQNNRLDIRFDSYKDNYDEYYKYNSFLVNSFSALFGCKGDEPTESRGQRTRRKKTVFAENYYMKVEYYNKGLECQYRFPPRARLEFRTLKVKGRCPHEIIKLWIDSLDQCLTMFEQVQHICNEDLLIHYNEWLKENRPKENKGDMLTAFFRGNHTTMFTLNQLERFCELCGINEPKKKAKYIKRRCMIECFSYPDFKGYIGKLKKWLIQYASS